MLKKLYSWITNLGLKDVEDEYLLLKLRNANLVLFVVPLVSVVLDFSNFDPVNAPIRFFLAIFLSALMFLNTFLNAQSKLIFTSLILPFLLVPTIFAIHVYEKFYYLELHNQIEISRYIFSTLMLLSYSFMIVLITPIVSRKLFLYIIGFHILLSALFFPTLHFLGINYNIAYDLTPFGEQVIITGLIVVFLFILGTAIIVMNQKNYLDMLKKSSDQLQISNFELDQSNKDIKVTMELLEESFEVRKKYFSIISHDIKNVFQGISMSLEVLGLRTKQYDDEKINKIIKSIGNKISESNEFLNDIVHWFKNEIYASDLEIVDVSLVDIYGEIDRLLKQEIENKGIFFTLEFEEDIVQAEKRSLSIVLRNLVHNAIKFSHENSEIVIRSKKVRNNIEISVIDYGQGIKDEQLEEVFSVHKSNKQKSSGSQFGLVICQELINRHDGEIKVQSIYGQGSVFTIVLPYQNQLNEKV